MKGKISASQAKRAFSLKKAIEAEGISHQQNYILVFTYPLVMSALEGR